MAYARLKLNYVSTQNLIEAFVAVVVFERVLLFLLFLLAFIISISSYYNDDGLIQTEEPT